MITLFFCWWKRRSKKFEYSASPTVTRPTFSWALSECRKHVSWFKIHSGTRFRRAVHFSPTEKAAKWKDTKKYGLYGIIRYYSQNTLECLYRVFFGLKNEWWPRAIVTKFRLYKNWVFRVSETAAVLSVAMEGVPERFDLFFFFFTRANYVV